jgi:glycosyltransferase involved in cell wall biosynthesis
MRLQPPRTPGRLTMVELAPGAKPVLVISQDVVGSAMAGPGIRYFHLARVLAREFPLVLAVPAGSDLETVPGLTLLQYTGFDDPALATIIHAARVIVVASDAAPRISELRHTRVPIAVDGYDPIQAENFYLTTGEAADKVDHLTLTYLLGDFFFCSSERQRDWWLGLLEANGRINSHNYQEDSTFRRFVDVVPFGLSEAPPIPTRSFVKGVWPGIGTDDKVLLWGGGLWPWLDPFTAVKAVAQLRDRRQDLRLIFPGTRHPNPVMSSIPTHTEAARRLAAELGILDTAVFFGDWVPYADWVNVLLESDLALTLHPRDSLESRLAFRSRVLDCIWAGLPTVAARGDVTADLIGEYGLGALVEPEAVDEVAAAVLSLLEVPHVDWPARFAAARQSLIWEAVIGPLAAFCRHPRLAPDKVARGAGVGNTYYLKQIAALERTRADLQKQVGAYESSRVLHWVRKLDPLVVRVDWLRRRVNKP